MLVRAGTGLHMRKHTNDWQCSVWLAQERIAERLPELYAKLVPGLARTKTPA